MTALVAAALALYLTGPAGAFGVRTPLHVRRTGSRLNPLTRIGSVQQPRTPQAPPRDLAAGPPAVDTLHDYEPSA